MHFHFLANMICGYELPTNLQNFTQKDLTEVNMFQRVFFWGGGTFLKHPVNVVASERTHARAGYGLKL